MNQDTYGDFLRYQESSGMRSDTTRLHKTWLQEICFLINLKILIKSWRILNISGRFESLGWTQLESTLKIIMVWIDNSSFGYDLTIWNLVKRGVYHRCVRTPWFLKLAPWRRMRRTINRVHERDARYSLKNAIIWRNAEMFILGTCQHCFDHRSLHMSSVAMDMPLGRNSSVYYCWGILEIKP